MPVFFRQDDAVGRKPPVYAQVGVVPSQCPFALWRIEVVTFILEDDFRCKYAEAMGESARYKELAVVVLSELYCHVAAECGRALPDIHRNVEHGSLDDPYQFALCIGRFLEMQPAQYAVAAFAFIVLNEMHGTYLAVEIALRKGLEEISPLVVEQTRLYDDHAVNSCFYYFHSEYAIFITYKDSFFPINKNEL